MYSPLPSKVNINFSQFLRLPFRRLLMALAKMTVYDLEEVELAYAPAYGSPKSPINMAGFVGAGMLRGDQKHVYPEVVVKVCSPQPTSHCYSNKHQYCWTSDRKLPGSPAEFRDPSTFPSAHSAPECPNSPRTNKSSSFASRARQRTTDFAF